MPKPYDVATKLCVALKNHAGPEAPVYTFAKILAEEYAPPEANAQVPEGWKLVPIEPPESIPEQGYDEELFQHCRDDDYRGLYRAMLKRVTPPC